MATNLRTVAYINGVRFFPRSVSVTVAVNSYLSFSLDVVPVAEWQLLPPRSHVVVFFVDPVTNTWRLLCEGEYIGRSRGKDSNGNRTRVLSCRGLFGFTDSATYTTVAGARDELAATAVRAWAGGTDVGTSASGPTQLHSVGALLSEAYQANPAGLFSSFMPSMLQKLAGQANVEAFYFEARRLATKMFAMPDAEIRRLIDFDRLDDVMKNGLATYAFGANTALSTIVSRIEAIANYVHVPLVAPPTFSTKPVRNGTTWSTTPRLPELLFLPLLYDTVPPACNVIFRDQLTSVNDSVDFGSLPTRVVGDLTSQSSMSDTAIPILYMANGVASPPADLTKNMRGSHAMSHGILSNEELYLGVQLQYHQLTMERLFPAGKQKDASIAAASAEASSKQLAGYAALATQAAWQVARGQQLRANVTAQFLPYLAPGFTTLVEDGDTPLLGFVDSVTHLLPSGGAPLTTVSLSQVREAYQVVGTTRTAPLSLHMNSAYAPRLIGSTFEQMLGCPASVTTARLEGLAKPDAASQILAALLGIEDIEAQVDIDQAVGEVVATPQYSADFASAGLVSDDTEADRLRTMADPKASQYEYQYRAGTSLAQYLNAHDLGQDVPDFDASVLDGSIDPPETIFNGPGDTNVLTSGPFLTPRQLTFADKEGPTTYGIYETGELSMVRAEIALTIADAIARQITDGSR